MGLATSPCPLPEPASGPGPGWHARLDLGYARRGGATVLRDNRHWGPLRVQRPLYPEGEAVCHTLVLHPPGGIAGGDRLDLSLDLDAGAHALVTTPGAGKWYKAAGREAEQSVSLRLETGAALEWLPQEAILFDGAAARQRLRVELGAGAVYLGWDIFCLGRIASGERFRQGLFSQRTEVRREGALLWREGLDLEGGGRLLASPIGLADRPVCGTLVAAAPGVDRAWAVAAREALADAPGLAGATALPGVLVARVLDHSTETARRSLAAVWAALRPLALDRDASAPRIWST